jgi:hypothetical protein
MSKSLKKHFFNPITGIPLDNNLDYSTEKGYKFIPEDNNKINNPRLYEDCNDLKENEIEFFVLWNNFKDSHELNEKNDSFDTLEKFVYMFITENIDYIKKNNLLNELTLFLNYLLDIGEISFTFFYLWTIKINL